MPYTTVAAVTGSAWQVSGENVGPEIIDNAINKADAVIDAYLGGVYVVPFATVPALVQHLSMTLARYYGLINVGKTMGTLGDPDKAAYSDAMKLLEGLRDREMFITNVAMVNADEAIYGTNIYSTNMDSPTIFDVDSEMAWGLSWRRAEAIDDGRDADWDGG
ncbi:MAG TPA: phage protein Gp36 family protein [Candidatus Krumholzibacteriaceae bacterium]